MDKGARQRPGFPLTTPRWWGAKYPAEESGYLGSSQFLPCVQGWWLPRTQITAGPKQFSWVRQWVWLGNHQRKNRAWSGHVTSQCQQLLPWTLPAENFIRTGSWEKQRKVGVPCKSAVLTTGYSAFVHINTYT